MKQDSQMRSLSFLTSLGLSVFIHIILFQFYFERSGPTYTPSAVNNSKIRIKVLPQRAALLPNKPQKKAQSLEAASKQEGRTHRRSHGPGLSAVGTKIHAPIKKLENYGQLFSEQFNPLSSKEGASGASDSSLAQHMGGASYQELGLDSEALRSLISVPYYIRESFSKEASARAVIYLASKGRLILRSLSGQATLRACLFEGISDSKGKKNLLSIASHLKVKTLTINLRLVPRISIDAKGLAHEYKTTLSRSGVSYEVYFDSSANPGGHLSDPYVKKDQAWDRISLRRLKESAAYKRSIRNLVL